MLLYVTKFHGIVMRLSMHLESVHVFVSCGVISISMALELTCTCAQCKESYMGPLCASCELGYAKTATGCSECPDLAQNIFFSLLVGILTVTVIFLLVRCVCYLT